MKTIVFEKSTGNILINVNIEVDGQGIEKEIRSIFHRHVIGINPRYKAVDVTGKDIEDHPQTITNINQISDHVYPILIDELWQTYLKFQSLYIDVNFLSLITYTQGKIREGLVLPKNQQVYDWINGLWGKYYEAKGNVIDNGIFDDNIEVQPLTLGYQDCLTELNEVQDV